MAKIDLSNFRVVKIGNADIERNYINDVLHALAEKALTPAAYVPTAAAPTTTTTSPVGIADAPINGIAYNRKDATWVAAGGGGISVAAVRKIAALRAY